MAMTPEAQRIAIAEACGWHARQCGANSATPGLWRIIPPDPKAIVAERFQTKEVAFELYAPDYLSDLNAMHEAEKTLDHDRSVMFRLWLSQNSDGKDAKFATVEAALCHATAAQRAEAFLKTIRKWRDEA